MRLELGEEQFDRIESRRVRGQEAELTPGRRHRGSRRRVFVNAQMVEHDDGARRQRRQQALPRLLVNDRSVERASGSVIPVGH